jgi:Bacterial type II and III secretion system protein
MRALTYGMLSILCGLSFNAARGEEPAAPDAEQVASCPTVLPVAAGERSIVVPSIASEVDPPLVAPGAAKSPDAEVSLLREKIAQRDALQREIDALAESTQTPEKFVLRLQLIEIDRSKLRQLGSDLARLGVDKSVNCIDADPALLDRLASLEQQKISHVLAKPSIVVASGRPAKFVVGNEISLPSADAKDGLRKETIGTQIDLTATSLGRNRVAVHLNPRVTALDQSHLHLANGDSVPGVTVRQIDTNLELEFGKTSVISGLVQERKTSTADWLGRKSDQVEEVALMLVVTPDVVR